MVDCGLSCTACSRHSSQGNQTSAAMATDSSSDGEWQAEIWLFADEAVLSPPRLLSAVPQPQITRAWSVRSTFALPTTLLRARTRQSTARRWSFA